MSNTAMLVFDLDGTLLDGAGNIPVSMRETLSHLVVRQGIVVVFATGRSWWGTREVIGGLPINQAVCDNGTVIVDPVDERVLAIHSFEPSAAIEVLNFGRSLDLIITATAYSRGQDGLKEHAFHEKPYCGRVEAVLRAIRLIPRLVHNLAVMEHHPSRLALYPHPDDAAFVEGAARDRFGGRHHPVYRYADEGIVEVLPARCSKASAVAQLAHELGIDPSHVMAFGDGNNDYEMLMEAGHAVAMSHAPEAILAIANGIIDWQNGEGVNLFLRRYFGL